MASMCAICLEPETQAIPCPACATYVCQPCFQTYLLGESLQPQCPEPSCRKAYPEHFAAEHISSAFKATYDAYTADLLYEAIKHQLEADQPKAAAYKAAKARSLELTKQELGLRRRYTYDAAFEYERDRVLFTIHTHGLHALRHNPPPPPPPANETAHKQLCPKGACPGTLVDSKCPLCTTEVCKSCNVTLSPHPQSHSCDPSDVASYNAIKAEAKPCPSCNVTISKVDGCDQMWCTQCHVTFSWLTGTPVDEPTHNPHYYEWRRLNGTLAPAPHRDAVCRPLVLRRTALTDCFSAQTKATASTLLQGWTARHNFEQAYPSHKPLLHGHLPLPVLPESEATHLPPAHYYVGLTKFYDTVTYNRYKANHLQRTPIDTYVLRITYLAGEISEAMFKSKLHACHTTYVQERTLFQIHDMVFRASMDLLIMFRQTIKAASTPDLSTAHNTYIQLRALFNYANTYLKKYAALFNRPSEPLYNPNPYGY